MAVFLTPYTADWMMGFARAPAVMPALTESLTVSWPKYVGTLENKYNIDSHDVMEHARYLEFESHQLVMAETGAKVLGVSALLRALSRLQHIGIQGR